MKLMGVSSISLQLVIRAKKTHLKVSMKYVIQVTISTFIDENGSFGIMYLLLKKTPVWISTYVDKT